VKKLAWTSDKLDASNTLVWGNYPTSRVIAMIILSYNKTMVEFDIIFDTDHVWAINSDPNNPDLTKTDLQNIATLAICSQSTIASSVLVL